MNLQTTVFMHFEEVALGQFDIKDAIFESIQQEQPVCGEILDVLEPYFPESSRDDIYDTILQVDFKSYLEQKEEDICLNEDAMEDVCRYNDKVRYVPICVPFDFDVERFVKDCEQNKDYIS